MNARRTPDVERKGGVSLTCTSFSVAPLFVIFITASMQQIATITISTTAMLKMARRKEEDSSFGECIYNTGTSASGSIIFRCCSERLYKNCRLVLTKEESYMKLKEGSLYMAQQSSFS